MLQFKGVICLWMHCYMSSACDFALIYISLNDVYPPQQTSEKVISSSDCNVFWSIDAAVTGKTGISASSIRISPGWQCKLPLEKNLTFTVDVLENVNIMNRNPPQTKQEKDPKLICILFLFISFIPPTLPGQSCCATASRRSGCWRVPKTRSRCWTSCRVCITAWLLTPGVTRPPCSPACAPSSGRSRRRLCGWSLTCGDAEYRIEKDLRKDRKY